MVIQMVIHSVSADTLPAFFIRQETHISEIVFAEHNRHTIQTIPVFQSRGILVPIVIILHFLIYGKQHRNLGQIRVYVFLNQFFLLTDNILQYLYIFRQRRLTLQGAVTFPAHTDGDEFLMSCTSFQTVGPVIQKAFFVYLIIPCRSIRGILTLYLVPLLAGTHTGLMMRVSDDNAICICQVHTCHPWTVQEKGGCPHRRPQIIAFHTEQQLKYMVIHFGIETAEMTERPVSKAWPFIVDEESTEFYRRFPGSHRQFCDHSCFYGTFCLTLAFSIDKLNPVIFLRRRISKIYERRYANEFRKLKQTIDRSPFVASRNYKSAFHTFCRFLHKLNGKYLPFTAHIRKVKSALSFHLLQKRTVSNGCRKNHCLLFANSFNDFRLRAADFLKILSYLFRCLFYARKRFRFQIKNEFLPSFKRYVFHDVLSLCFPAKNSYRSAGKQYFIFVFFHYKRVPAELL